MCLCGDTLVSLPFGFQRSHWECPEAGKGKHPFSSFGLDKRVGARHADIRNIVPIFGYPNERAAPTWTFYSHVQSILKIFTPPPPPQCLSDIDISQVFRCDLNQHRQEGILRNRWKPSGWCRFPSHGGGEQEYNDDLVH